MSLPISWKTKLPPGLSGKGEIIAAPYAHAGYNRFVDLEGYPAVSPPGAHSTPLTSTRRRNPVESTAGEYEELT
ncbi:MAG: hypothetical protein R3C61_17235 [Bacteroidia bacterium]